MAKFVKLIGTGEKGIAIESGPNTHIVAVIRPIKVRVVVFCFFILILSNMYYPWNDIIIVKYESIVNKKYESG